MVSNNAKVLVFKVRNLDPVKFYCIFLMHMLVHLVGKLVEKLYSKTNLNITQRNAFAIISISAL